MTYMEMLAGSTRTNAPVRRVATIGTAQDARRYAATMQRSDDDSHEFRSMRALMHQSYSFAG